MWRYDQERAAIDITGADFIASRRFRNVQEIHRAAFVVDDLASVDPWRPRGVLIRGRAEAIDGTPHGGRPTIRIFADTIASWGLDPAPSSRSEGRG